MSNKDQAKRSVSTSELEQIKDKFPEMVKKFEDVKKQAYEPQIQGLGQDHGQQAHQQGQGQGQGQTS